MDQNQIQKNHQNIDENLLNADEISQNHPSTSQEIETPAELSGKYRFLRHIGQGAQANVFEAVRLSDEKHVAIKVLSINSVQNWKDYELFHRESETLRSLHIKGIAEFYESPEFLDQPKPRAFIIQEFIEGRSLNDMIKSGYRFSLNRVFEIAVDLINLLEKLHHHDPPIIHRDLKPANIMCRRSDSRDYEIYLIDFGAVSNPKVQGGGSTIAGTCGYMPPEQLMGKPCPASDIYALGATLAYMLCGVDPGQMQVTDFHLIIEPHLELVPPEIVNVLRKMLEPAVDNRLCDYEQLRNIFTDFANNHFHYCADSLSDTEEISKQFAKVNRYGQPGNLDIWAALKDNTPRHTPVQITKLKQTEMLSHTPVKKALNIKKTGKFKQSVYPIVIAFWVISIILFILARHDYNNEKSNWQRVVDECNNKYEDIIQKGLIKEYGMTEVPCDAQCALNAKNSCEKGLLYDIRRYNIDSKTMKCLSRNSFAERNKDDVECFNRLDSYYQVFHDCIVISDDKVGSRVMNIQPECQNKINAYLIGVSETNPVVQRVTIDRNEGLKNCDEKYQEILKSGKNSEYGTYNKPCDEKCALKARESCQIWKSRRFRHDDYRKDSLRYDSGFETYLNDRIHIDNHIEFLLYFGGSIFLILFGFIIIIISKKRKKFSIVYGDFQTPSDFINIENLLSMGRKSIAIITSVQYIPATEGTVECYQKHQNLPDSWYSHGLPSFRLRYKFNPIDDAASQDLVHEIIIHDAPGDALQPGNPIPILYYIDPHDNAQVWSMPYPFPTDSIIHLGDIYSQSHELDSKVSS